MDMELKYKIMR